MVVTIRVNFLVILCIIRNNWAIPVATHGETSQQSTDPVGAKETSPYHLAKIFFPGQYPPNPVVNGEKTTSDCLPSLIPSQQMINRLRKAVSVCVRTSIKKTLAFKETLPCEEIRDVIRQKVPASSVGSTVAAQKAKPMDKVLTKNVTDVDSELLTTQSSITTETPTTKRSGKRRRLTRSAENDSEEGEDENEDEEYEYDESLVEVLTHNEESDSKKAAKLQEKEEESEGGSDGEGGLNDSGLNDNEESANENEAQTEDGAVAANEEETAEGENEQAVETTEGTEEGANPEGEEQVIEEELTADQPIGEEAAEGTEAVAGGGSESQTEESIASTTVAGAGTVIDETSSVAADTEGVATPPTHEEIIKKTSNLVSSSKVVRPTEDAITEGSLGIDVVVSNLTGMEELNFIAEVLNGAAGNHHKKSGNVLLPTLGSHAMFVLDADEPHTDHTLTVAIETPGVAAAFSVSPVTEPVQQFLMHLMREKLNEYMQGCIARELELVDAKGIFQPSLFKKFIALAFKDETDKDFMTVASIIDECEKLTKNVKASVRPHAFSIGCFEPKLAEICSSRQRPVSSNLESLVDQSVTVVVNELVPSIEDGPAKEAVLHKVSNIVDSMAKVLHSTSPKNTSSPNTVPPSGSRQKPKKENGSAKPPVKVLTTQSTSAATTLTETQPTFSTPAQTDESTLLIIETKPAEGLTDITSTDTGIQLTEISLNVTELPQFAMSVPVPTIDVAAATDTPLSVSGVVLDDPGPRPTTLSKNVTIIKDSAVTAIKIHA